MTEKKKRSGSMKFLGYLAVGICGGLWTVFTFFFPGWMEKNIYPKIKERFIDDIPIEEKEEGSDDL